MTWLRRVGLAGLGCLFVYAAVALRVIGTLLHQYQQPGAQAYGASVFTNPAISTKGLLGAAGPHGLWTDAGVSTGSSVPVPDVLVSLHLTIDFFLYVPLVAAGLFLLLRASSRFEGDHRKDQVAIRIAVAYLLLDWLETAGTAVVFRCNWLKGGECAFGISAPWASAIHIASDAKWAALALGLLVSVLRAVANRHVIVARARRLGIVARDLEGVPGTPPALIVIVVVYLALVALPAGGALDQLPDVLRADIDRASWSDLTSLVRPLVGVALLAATLLIAGAPGTRSVETKDLPRWPGYAALAVIAAVPIVVYLGVEHSVSDAMIPTLALAVTLGGAYLLARLAKWAVPTWQEHEDTHPAVAAEVAGQQAPEAKKVSEVDRQKTATRRARITVSVLVGCVVLGTGLGLLRATLPVVLLPGDTPTAYGWLWGISVLVSVVVAPGVAVLVYGGLLLAGRKPSLLRRRVGVVVCVGSVLWAGILAVDPTVAYGLGAVSTLTVALSAYVSVFGLIGWVTRRWSWTAIRNPNPSLATRTPWALLLVVAFMVASLSDVRGAYHDARTVPDEETSRGTLEQRWNAWVAAWNHLSKTERQACTTDAGTIPLVMVAAPGGGAKAAYWTAIGMDRLFGEDGACPISLFAASGVSGGAVGLTVSLAIPPTAPAQRLSPTAATTARNEADKVTDEGPLAEILAGMLLRDLPRPMTGLSYSWADRATLIEEAWANSSSVLDDERVGDSSTTTLDDLGRGWWTPNQTTQPKRQPVLLLNGTSVTDGCRAVVTTVKDLSVSPSNCLAAPLSGRTVTGVESASLDVLDGLLPSTGYLGEAEGDNPSSLCKPGVSNQPQTLPATTAALLAARFPYVTPSGAVRRCVTVGDNTSTVTSYVVDGGYLENTGLLSILQTWHGIAPLVRACNDADATGAEAANGVKCPTFKKAAIEPWVVLLENHYTSQAAVPGAKRPHELLVPPQTFLTKKGTSLGTPALEQVAAAEIDGRMGGDVGLCGRFFALAPDVKAEVQAPLGWVLAPSTRTRMDESLAAAWSQVADRLDDQHPGCQPLIREPATP